MRTLLFELLLLALLLAILLATSTAVLLAALAPVLLAVTGPIAIFHLVVRHLLTPFAQMIRRKRNRR